FQHFAELVPVPAPPPAPAMLPPPHSLPEPERALAGCLAAASLGADELAARLGRPVREVLVQLAALEIGGIVARDPDGRFRRVHPSGSPQR
ncbi:MAG TPA: hypothetical protein VFK09_06850, partial [Gemmatimonadales bacterium]|nr:hypothetical protein [Gemmatimonadales bacterium]